MNRPFWIKSTYCDSAGINCMEVAMHPAGASGVRIRDSADPHGAEISCGPAAWIEFLAWAAWRGEAGPAKQSRGAP
ncbi:DUF397 domain-containing protein [Streptomyces sp. NPDC005970]|uniref:DUF397 domain-containing protein n=1 Tax=Streptomyces sp. NPDC005970 TaxID=3156723 RepID=UPI0033CA8ACC